MNQKRKMSRFAGDVKIQRTVKSEDYCRTISMSWQDRWMVNWQMVKFSMFAKPMLNASSVPPGSFEFNFWHHCLRGT